MITNLFLSLGLTRDSLVWFWSRLVSGAAIVLSIVVSGSHILDPYVPPSAMKVLAILAVLVLWLAGKFDSSPLPGQKP
jgi:hypothetical protein